MITDIKTEYKNILITKIKNGGSYIHLIRWMRIQDKEMTLQGAVDWARNLPQTIGPFDENELQVKQKELSILVEFKILDSYHEYESKSDVNLRDAKLWFDSLPEQNKNRIACLIQANQPTAF